MHLKLGDRVRHAKWGAGVVLKKLPSKAARVAFDSAPSLPRTLKLSDLDLLLGESEEVVSSSARSAALGPAQVRKSAPLVPRWGNSDSSLAELLRAPAPVPTGVATAAQEAFSTELDEADSWQTLEALRLGVVPALGVRDYTVARKEELGSLAGMLDASHGCRVLWGDYGTGKTHLLEAAEQLALERGFATARITLDPRENALHRPLRLYKRVVDSIRVKDHVGQGLDWLFEKLLESPEHFTSDGTRSSRFFSPYLHVLRSGTVEHGASMRDYVLGQNVDTNSVNYIARYVGWQGKRPLRMSDYRTYGRMYTHLVGTLACWFADAGLRGLVLLFDEVERVDALSRTDQEYALEVLKHYASVTMDPSDLAFDQDDLYRGGHKVHRELSLRFQETQPLSVVFALTPLEEICEQFQSITTSGSYDIHLRPLQPDLLGDLVPRIAAIYERAYGAHTVSEAVRQRAVSLLTDAYEGGHDSFRSAVRATVFMLDADRFQSARTGSE